MKSAALVLGLALAANAQVDNELATSLPYNPSGADLVRNAGWGRHLPIPTRSTFTRFDETADDELLVNLWSPSGADLANHRGRPDTDKYGRPYTDMRGNPLGRPVYRDDEFMSLSGADLVKYAKQSQQTVYRPTAHVVRDDATDDELMVYYTKDSQGNKHYQGGYTIRRDDATDDELMVYYTKDSQGNKHYQGGYTVRRDDAADDELVQTFYSPSGADLVKYAKQSQQTVYRPTAHVVRDDATDDELMVYYTKDSQGNKHYQGGYTVRRDDAADDELVQTFYSPSGADLVKYAKQSQQTVYRPTAHVVRDDATDDELMVYYTKDSNGVNHYQPYPTPTRRDDADDELAYLGHLIKETQPEKVEKKTHQRHFRPVEKN